VPPPGFRAGERSAVSPRVIHVLSPDLVTMDNLMIIPLRVALCCHNRASIFRNQVPRSKLDKNAVARRECQVGFHFRWQAIPRGDPFAKQSAAVHDHSERASWFE